MISFTQLFTAAGIILALLIRTTPSVPTYPKPVLTEVRYRPVAVVELFTSQGCSSCPSADRLLTETLNEAAKNRKNIIGLSFHIDYWDRLGWKDPFSEHAFTQRQYKYSEHFNQRVPAGRGVYTPQAVVNGRQEFVGSSRSKQTSALADALNQPATVDVKLTATAPAANKLTVAYQLEGKLVDAVLNVALVSKTTETTVQRGENAGRKLVHDNVVRVFQTVPAVAKGNLTIVLPAGYDAKNGAVVAYVQGRQTLAVQGAGQVNL